ncbi:hypothetical protein BSKO_11657 [Bryopsis sp. KO-2023]|nr:hypothetical protein BSKO_11657 [Bryopsis sp. KO-2023]
MSSVLGGDVQFVYEVGECPKQANEDDCGVFLLSTARALVLGRPFDHTPDQVEGIRTRILLELTQDRLHP